MRLAILISIFVVIADAGARGESARRGASKMTKVPPTMTVRRNPVLLIHGIKDDARKMEPMARYLRAQGWEAHTMSLLPSWGQTGLDDLAQQIDAEVKRTFAPGQTIDLVAFSMGGLVARYYLQRLGGLKRVQRFVTISTPHHGTVLASLAFRTSNRGFRQMSPGSGFLRDLDSDADQLDAIEFTSFWTPFDLVILPARSSEVMQARNVKLWVILHPLMVYQPSCLRAVAEALRGRQLARGG